jgi:hypothetical protein
MELRFLLPGQSSNWRRQAGLPLLPQPQQQLGVPVYAHNTSAAAAAAVLLPHGPGRFQVPLHDCHFGIRRQLELLRL